MLPGRSQTKMKGGRGGLLKSRNKKDDRYQCQGFFSNDLVKIRILRARPKAERVFAEYENFLKLSDRPTDRDAFQRLIYALRFKFLMVMKKPTCTITYPAKSLNNDHHKLILSQLRNAVVRNGFRSTDINRELTPSSLSLPTVCSCRFSRSTPAFCCSASSSRIELSLSRSVSLASCCCSAVSRDSRLLSS